MAPRRHEIMRVRESKVITIKTLGLNQEHISHFKREREREMQTQDEDTATSLLS